MKNLKALFFVLSLAASFCFYGQTKTPIDEKPFIEVTGIAEQEIIPDEIIINITLREKTNNKEKISIEMQEENLKTSLKENGIDVKHLFLSDANSDYVKVRWRTKDVLTKKNYSLKVNNATMVGQVFQTLDKLEISDAHIARVNHSKMDSIKREVRISAIKAAKAKADYLLSAIGEQTGKPLVIQEKENAYIDASMLNVRGGKSSSVQYYIDGDKVNDDDNVQFQKLKVHSAIYVKFSIK